MSRKLSWAEMERREQKSITLGRGRQPGRRCRPPHGCGSTPRPGSSPNSPTPSTLLCEPARLCGITTGQTSRIEPEQEIRLKRIVSAAGLRAAHSHATGSSKSVVISATQALMRVEPLIAEELCVRRDPELEFHCPLARSTTDGQSEPDSQRDAPLATADVAFVAVPSGDWQFRRDAASADNVPPSSRIQRWQHQPGVVTVMRSMRS